MYRTNVVYGSIVFGGPSLLYQQVGELAQGALKKKVTGLGVVGWFLGGQKSTRVGQIFSRDFFIVFLNSPYRETPKNVLKKKVKKKKFGVGWFLES
jgi:hypothetical protein